jgi:hypothetical protein
MPRPTQKLQRAFVCAAALAAAGGAWGCGTRTHPAAGPLLHAGQRLELAGAFAFPPSAVFPPGGARFGGLSGLAPAGTPGEYFAVSDDRIAHRLYRIRVSGTGPSFRADVLETITLDSSERALRLDPEAIVVMRTGDLLIASEGRGTEAARVPPAIAQYSRTGRFLRQLPIPDRFLPDGAPTPTRGVRGNAGFESLTLSPSGRRLFTATETALAQDGERVSFDHGTTARLLEYVADGGTFVPAREFAYPLDAMDAAPFTAGATAAGIVELLALSDDELLALERTFIEAAGQRRGINRIRLYRVSTRGADDVSAIDSLVGAASVRPARKTLVLDLSELTGLSSELSTLDNFEGLAEGQRLPDGSRSLLLVSDDNFNQAQRTWFLQLRFVSR